MEDKPAARKFRMSPEKINILLTRLGISQKELAAQLGISPQSISEMKAGRSNLSLKTYQKLRELYLVNLNWLIGDDESPIISLPGRQKKDAGTELKKRKKSELIEMINELQENPGSEVKDDDLKVLARALKGKSVQKQRAILRLIEELSED